MADSAVLLWLDPLPASSDAIDADKCTGRDALCSCFSEAVAGEATRGSFAAETREFGREPWPLASLSALLAGDALGVSMFGRACMDLAKDVNSARSIEVTSHITALKVVASDFSLVGMVMRPGGMSDDVDVKSNTRCWWTKAVECFFLQNWDAIRKLR